MNDMNVWARRLVPTAPAFRQQSNEPGRPVSNQTKRHHAKQPSSAGRSLSRRAPAYASLLRALLLLGFCCFTVAQRQCTGTSAATFAAAAQYGGRYAAAFSRAFRENKHVCTRGCLPNAQGIQALSALEMSLYGLRNAKFALNASRLGSHRDVQMVLDGEASVLKAIGGLKRASITAAALQTTVHTTAQLLLERSAVLVKGDSVSTPNGDVKYRNNQGIAYRESNLFLKIDHTLQTLLSNNLYLVPNFSSGYFS